MHPSFMHILQPDTSWPNVHKTPGFSPVQNRGGLYQKGHQDHDMLCIEFLYLAHCFYAPLCYYFNLIPHGLVLPSVGSGFLFVVSSPSIQ